jgi:hypothetical protein
MALIRTDVSEELSSTPHNHEALHSLLQEELYLTRASHMHLLLRPPCPFIHYSYLWSHSSPRSVPLHVPSSTTPTCGLILLRALCPSMSLHPLLLHVVSFFSTLCTPPSRSPPCGLILLHASHLPLHPVLLPVVSFFSTLLICPSIQLSYLWSHSFLSAAPWAKRTQCKCERLVASHAVPL